MDVPSSSAAHGLQNVAVSLHSRYIWGAWYHSKDIHIELKAMRNWHENTNGPNVGSGPDVSVALMFMTHTLKKGKRQNSTCAFLAKSRWLSVLPFPPPLDLLPLTPPLDLLSFPPPAFSSVISVNHSKAQKYFFLAKNKTYSPKASKSENLPPAYNCTGEPAEVFSSNVSKKEYCFYIEKKKQS